jgi:GDP-mannose 4,6-dehydratase
MVGSHLADYILRFHPMEEIHGMIRWRSPLDNIEQCLEKITLHHGDLLDMNSIMKVLRDSRPDWIFHLAAQSYVPFSFVAPAVTLNTNVTGTSNLLEAMRITRTNAKIHICSSSEVYGQVGPDEVPITETNEFRPASPYAVSKVGEDMLALQHFMSYGTQTVRTRMFTHTGPRRGDVFAESSFAKQIAEIEAGIKPNPVRVGNLASVRTLSDVRDAVRAYWLLMERCPAGEVYNIGGDRPTTVGDVLATLIGMATCDIQHVVDPTRIRPSDVTLQIPDSSRFREATGWQPEIDPAQTLRDLLDYHRQKIGTDRIAE